MTTSVYVFNGFKLMEYSDLGVFKNMLQKEGISNNGGTIKEVFENIFSNESESYPKLKRLYFEHVFYGQLKNVYVHKIVNSMPKKDRFITKIQAIINEMNIKESIPPQYHELFDAGEGFYELDILDLNNTGNVFLLGYDYELDHRHQVKIARFLIAQVVRKDGIPIYYLSAVEVNYQEKFYMVMFRNVIGIDRTPTEEELLEDELWDNTMNKFIARINRSILTPLSIVEQFDYKADRAGMYQMCKFLDDTLLEEYREVIETSLGNTVDLSIENWSSSFFIEPYQLSDNQKSTLKNKICSQLLSLYLKNNDDIDLVEKSRQLDLIGYTTRIEFNANRAGKGATKSRSGSDPIATEDMFHSLYIDFTGALELPKWSLAWFTDEEGDYIQTTIHTTTKYFKIVFLPDRQLDKETIYRVIRYINQYRNYEV